jgi:hypothetical protein
MRVRHRLGVGIVATAADARSSSQSLCVQNHSHVHAHTTYLQQKQCHTNISNTATQSYAPWAAASIAARRSACACAARDNGAVFASLRVGVVGLVSVGARDTDATSSRSALADSMHPDEQSRTASKSSEP